MKESNNPAPNDRREVLGWISYDWANSTFYTTVVTVLTGPYLQALAADAVGADGTVVDLGIFGTVTPKSMISLFLGISILVQVFFLPVLGAIADYTHLKKKLMAIFSYIGVISGALLFFIVGEHYLWGCLLLMFGNMAFAAANVFYNAYLIDVVTENHRDRISLYGYAAGYLGGTLMLVINLLFIQNAESLGVSKGLAVRGSILAASLWWGIFGAVSFLLLKSRGRSREIPVGRSIMTIGFTEVWTTLRELTKLKYTMLFLIAYLFYNDGIQTVILNSSVFIANEMFVSKGRETDQSFLLLIFLIAQVSALCGALVFVRVSKWLGSKKTILFSLLMWSGIVLYAYSFFGTNQPAEFLGEQFNRVGEFFGQGFPAGQRATATLSSAVDGFQIKQQAMLLGGLIGIVLGCTQALSRSLFSQMIPAGRESSFFGLYEISEKGTSWMGNIVFSIVVASTGSFRQALLAVIVFFIIGMIVLIFTNVTRAIHEAGNMTPDEAASGRS